jgi:hypothetical protein
LRIYEAVIDELMEKGLANATQVILNSASSHPVLEETLVHRSFLQFQHHVKIKQSPFPTHFRPSLQVVLLVV